jgi:hypothetical protein
VTFWLLCFGAYVAVAAVLAVISGALNWGRFFEPQDMFAWPIMVVTGLVALPFWLTFHGLSLLGKLGRKLAGREPKRGRLVW